MFASLLFASFAPVAAVQAQDCLVPSLSFDMPGLRTERVATSGSVSYALQRSATGTHVIDVRGRLVAGSQPPSLGTIEMKSPMLSSRSVKFAGLSADALGVQAIAADLAKSQAVLVEWRQDAQKNWNESKLVLSGTTVAEGSNLAFDGHRWAALSVTEPGDVFVDLIARDKAGQLTIQETLPIAVSNAIAPERPTAVALDGGLLVLRVTADSYMGTLVLEDLPGVGWSLEATLPEVFRDAEPTTAAIAIKGDRIAVARDLGKSFQQHVVMMYSRNPVTHAGWNPVAMLELPGASIKGLNRRNIHDVKIQGKRVWVSQGTDRILTAYTRTAPGGDYERVGLIRGVGGPIAATADWVAALTASGSAFAGVDAFKLCPVLHAE